MNKDDLLKLGKSILEKFQNKELQEQRAFIKEANKAEDVNDFLFKEYPEALKWYKFINTKKENNWYSSKDAEELYNSADTFAKRCLFVLHWFESISYINLTSKEEVSSLYANIVGRLKLKYSDFATPDSLLGSLLKIKDEKVFAKKLIYALHIFDGTPIEESKIVLEPTADNISCLKDFHFNNKECEYLQALIIGFSVYKPYLHSNFNSKLDVSTMKSIVEREKTEELEPQDLIYYISNNVYLQNMSNVEEYLKVEYDRNRKHAWWNFSTFVGRYFKIYPDFSLSSKCDILAIFPHKTKEVLETGNKEIKASTKIRNLGISSILCLFFALMFSIFGSIPLQLFAGLLIVLGLMGAFLYVPRIKDINQSVFSLYTKLNIIKDDTKKVSEFINQDEADKIDDERKYINSLGEYSKIYKELYIIYKQRQELADKMYLEDPQQFHEMLLENTIRELNARMERENSNAFSDEFDENEDECFDEFDEIEERALQQEKIRAAEWEREYEARLEREEREKAEREREWEKIKAKDEAKRAEDDAKRAGLLQCRHCSRRDKCSFWVQRNNKGNCASYRP